MGFLRKLIKGDLVIWFIFMFLCLISLVEVFSATSTIAYRSDYYWTPIVRHAIFLLCGFAVVLVLHNVPYKYFSAFILLLPISLILLIITPIFGVEANDAHRWFSFFGIQFQPSEFGKLACVVYVAFFLSKRGKIPDNKIFNIILIGVGLICLFILPENFSTAFMLFGICFLMMFIGQMPLKKVGMLAGVLILCLAFFVVALTTFPESVLKYVPRALTWKGRIVEHLDSKKDNIEEENGTYVITDDNYQVTHAKIAIARGGLLGKLPGHSQQRDVLPQAFSDFIYAIIFEELGFVGGMFVLFLYIILLIRVGIIARRCEKDFPRFLVLGCGLLVVVQALANMAVAVNLIPVTGQPLPLISRGGTSTVLTCCYFGIILSISRFGANMGNSEKDSEEETVLEQDTQSLTEEEVSNWIPEEHTEESER